MSDTVHDRVTDLLEEAEANADSIRSAEGSAEPTALLETARSANEFVEGESPQGLLEAVGLAELPDGSEPGSIPEAIAKGDPERVETLSRLLHLANLAESDDGEALEGAVHSLRETVDERSGADGQKAGAQSSTADAEDASPSADTEADSLIDKTGAAVEEQLRSAMQSTVEGFGNDIEALRASLREAGGAADTSDDTAVGSDAESEGGSESDEEAPAEPSGDEDDGLLSSVAGDEDEGLLSMGSDDEDEEEGGLLGGRSDDAARGSTKHSTVAVSPSKRADMRAVSRFSTMPKKR